MGVTAITTAIVAVAAILLAVFALGAVPASAQAPQGERVDLPQYTDPLPPEPKAMVVAFFEDHTAWNAFARDHYDRTKDFAEAEKAYRRLIDLYCGPDKTHQGITFSSDPSYDADRTEILDEREEEGRRIVKTRHTTDNGFVAIHEFVFVRRRDRWWLDEVYYYDDYGDEWLPSL